MNRSSGLFLLTGPFSLTRNGPFYPTREWPFSPDPNKGYIRAHLKYAGCTQELFTDTALDRVYQLSSGIPRMINRICEKSLMYAFQHQKRLIDDHMVSYVADHEMLAASE